jgi:pimeloyl-ACP methyl ester carboxylesterase
VAEVWQSQFSVLADHGYRVWAPNQRGYGRTTRFPHVRDYAVECLMDDVAALIDVAGARRVLLLGHDWGAIVAWCFAARALRPLEGLVIINVPHPVCFARALRRPGQLMGSWYAGLFQIPWLPEYLLSRRGARAITQAMLRTSTAPDRFPRGLLKATRENAVQPGALRAMIHWYRAFIRGGGLRRQLRQGFPIIDIPTLMLWGENDPFLARYTTYGTAEFVSNLRLHYLPGVSHWVQQDATAECNRLIAEFIERLE